MIFNLESVIKEALVFRGGTALNKLFIKPSVRYSEDIDFVQKRSEPIGRTIDAIRELLNPWLGEPRWKITQRSCHYFCKCVEIKSSNNLVRLGSACCCEYIA